MGLTSPSVTIKKSVTYFFERIVRHLKVFRLLYCSSLHGLLLLMLLLLLLLLFRSLVADRENCLLSQGVIALLRYLEVTSSLLRYFLI